MDAFSTADSTSFSPSVGHIPRFYGHPKHGLPLGYGTESRENKENAVLPPGTPPGAGYGYTPSLDSVPARENGEIVTIAGYNLREILLGADAFAGYVSSSANGNAPITPPTEHLVDILTADDPGSTLLLPAVPPSSPFVYPNSSCDKRSGSAIELELTLTDYPVPLMPSPLDTIDGLFAASGGHDFIPTAFLGTSVDLDLGALDSATGCLDSDLDSLSVLANIPNYMTGVLDEHSTFYESLPLHTKHDPLGDSIDATNHSNLLGIDFCFGAGADHFVLTLTGFEFCE